jgi:uncharacterized protein
MILMNTSKNINLSTQLKKADSFAARLKGLIGVSKLNPDEALWINDCPSIHTFFMSFDIDVLFVDSNLKVKAKYENVKPWRLILPVWGAKSVIEFAAGTLINRNVEVGDQLNVVH